jgi:hypothetical protein
MRYSKHHITVLVFCLFLVGWITTYAQGPLAREAASSAISRATTGESMNLAGEWEGGAEWKGLKFKITFSVPPEVREVRNLEVSCQCIQGTGGISATLTKPAPISEADTFEFTAGQGSRGTGSFVTGQSAKGTYQAPFSLKCGEEFLEASGEWTAKKKN